jgi:hypothetical protein
MAKILSGAAWVAKFPNSARVDDLVEPFRSNARKFIAALKSAGATVAVASTRRPPERAYLMHWSFSISAGLDPEQVPGMAGVEIEWVHRNLTGVKDLAASKAAASAMVAGYDIAFAPALTSRHIEGKAIDMDISWTTPALTITNGAGQAVTISSGAKNGGNPELHKVGASYSVVKLVTDPPHWSIDGH